MFRQVQTNRETYTDLGAGGVNRFINNNRTYSGVEISHRSCFSRHLSAVRQKAVNWTNSIKINQFIDSIRINSMAFDALFYCIIVCPEIHYTTIDMLVDCILYSLISHHVCINCWLDLCFFCVAAAAAAPPPSWCLSSSLSFRFIQFYPNRIEIDSCPPPFPPYQAKRENKVARNF